MRKFVIVFGTRPEYLKMKPVISAFKNSRISHKVIYVKQHEQIQETIDIDTITLSLDKTTENRLSCIGSEILLKLPVLIEESTDILVQGDTATAFYSALCAFQMKKRVIHLEAGLRTYDLERPYPEEAYRQMISRIATVHLTPHHDSTELLKRECVSGDIYTVGNTILDLVKSYNLSIQESNKILITFHRRENWDKIDMLLEGLSKVVKRWPSLEFTWYLHPNPELQEKVKRGIESLPMITLAGPANHYEFTQQIASTKFLITDSGGIQEEASFLGKHCIVLRASTERNHIPPQYITVLENYSELDWAIENISKFINSPCIVYGNGDSAEKIVNILSR